MIQDFKHNGLQLLFETGSTRGVNPQWKRRLLDRLTVLDAAEDIAEMDIPGWRLHQLKGDRVGTWSVNVTGNWRLTFRFTEGDAFDVDLEDYH